MRKFALDAAARDQLERAQHRSGRSATTLVGGHERSLRHTVIALTAGTALQEHQAAGEATLQVISGRVSLRTDGDSWECRQGDLLDIPPSAHSVTALEDSAILLTVSLS